MPIAVLKFDLNDADDSMHHLRCVKSTDMALVLWELVYNMKRKYIDDCGEEVYEVVDKIFNDITELMNERNINLDELIV